MRYPLLLALPLVVSGCASSSFAPPAVAVAYQGSSGVETSVCPVGGSRGTAVTVTRDVAGAYKLIDKFIETFRCSAHSAANGRQAFEIPAFLATTGAAAATALGGGATYGIVGTGVNSLFTNGNKYWDPKLKAGIYDHALDALICVKTEAVDIPAYDIEEAAKLEKRTFAAEHPGSTIGVSVDQQYFEMVSGAAFSIERILAQRLSNMASVDASAVSAELTKSIEDVRAKEKERKDKLANGTGGTGNNGNNGNNGNKSFDIATFAAEMTARPKQTMVKLDLSVLKPKLDQCVLRAKL